MSSLGLGIVADAVDVAGSDPFGLGILLHVDLLLATEVLTFDFLSNASGSGFQPVPIPNDPMLIGQVFYAQSLWAEDTAGGLSCSVSPLHLVSSRGVAITIQN